MSSRFEDVATMKCAVASWWRGTNLSTDPIVTTIFGTAPDPDTSVASADLVLYSAFGMDHTPSRGTTVSWSGEPWMPTGDDANWTIDWRHRGLDNHLRLPFWTKPLLGSPDALTLEPNDPDARRFCAFMYSNPRCGMRNSFFEMLNRREPVDALGVVHHNADHPALSQRHDKEWWNTKRIALRDYRFTIAFESEEHVGYTTEKLVDAWLADSVPIYWGNPAVEIDFPAGSYLSFYEAGSMARLVDMVLEAHHDPVRYAELQAANPLRTGHLAELMARYVNDFDAFADRVVADALEHRGRPRRSLAISFVGRQRLLRTEIKTALRTRLS